MTLPLAPQPPKRRPELRKWLGSEWTIGQTGQPALLPFHVSGLRAISKTVLVLPQRKYTQFSPAQLAALKGGATVPHTDQGLSFKVSCYQGVKRREELGFVLRN